MPTVIHCPSCERKLKVPETLLGKKVKCPSCGTQFTGAAPDEGPAEEQEEPTEVRVRVRAGSPPRRRQEEEEEEPQEQEEAEEQEEQEEDERPRERRRRRRGRRDAEPHRGGLVLTLGIISVAMSGVALVGCCIFAPAGFLAVVGLALGIPAWVMGARDLRKMDRGVMDREGRGPTRGGYICGIIGTISAAIMVVLVVLAVLLFGSLFAYLASQGKLQQQQQQQPPPGFPRPPVGPGRFQSAPGGLPRLQDYLPRRFPAGGVGVPNF
jgi:hypothetical protein